MTSCNHKVKLTTWIQGLISPQRYKLQQWDRYHVPQNVFWFKTALTQQPWFFRYQGTLIFLNCYYYCNITGNTDRSLDERHVGYDLDRLLQRVTVPPRAEGCYNSCSSYSHCRTHRWQNTRSNYTQDTVVSRHSAHWHTVPHQSYYWQIRHHLTGIFSAATVYFNSLASFKHSLKNVDFSM